MTDREEYDTGYDARRVSGTARWTAAVRARESARDDRLFDDPLAAALAGPAGFAMADRHDPPGGNPFLPLRTRWYDDALTAAVTAGTRQVVLLAAGLDTRAYRMDWPETTAVFEVDQPALLEEKQKLLDAEGARPRCRRVPVRADLTGDWGGALRTAGFDPHAPSVIAAEGLLQYLPEPLARDVPATAAGLAAPGSRLAIDLISATLIRSPYMRETLDRLREAGVPWLFGTDDPEGFVAGCGWRPDVVCQPGEEGTTYGRPWPYPPAPRDAPELADLPRTFLVTAVRAT